MGVQGQHRPFEFLLAQALRLLPVFPGLLFGWLRARTGGIAAPVVAHALSNLALRFLEASLLPR